MDDFEEYRRENNQGMLLVCKAETEDALRKLEEYQNSYQKVIMELDDERKKYQLKEEESKRTI